MTKTLFNLPNILNHRVGLQENYPLSPHHRLISSMASDRQRMQLIYWSSLGHKLLDAFSGAKDAKGVYQSTSFSRGAVDRR
jgi:hypothetical protein